ncbi:MAG: hypothetical protein LW832_06215 [Parachlamydia sp.]|jgi:hypothetical protein|nr:hypothetical protein [Parachlamydia sp.]
MEYFINYGRWQNRIFISPIDQEDIKKAVFFCASYEGAGVRCYSRLYGCLLYYLSIASQLHINGNRVYVNNNSLAKFALRVKKIESEQVFHARHAAMKLNYAYLEYRKKGYDRQQLNQARQELRKRKGVILDIQSLMQDMITNAEKTG